MTGWRGAIDIVGISSFATFLKNTEGYRRDLRRAEYGDERDPAMRAVFDRISPLNLTARINEAAVRRPGPQRSARALDRGRADRRQGRCRGGEVWYLLDADEGHGFRKKQNVDAQREAETLFLRKVLKL